MKPTRMTIKWPTKCHHCGMKLDEGMPAYGEKSDTTGQWKFSCLDCGAGGAVADAKSGAVKQAASALMGELLDVPSVANMIDAMANGGAVKPNLCPGCGCEIDPDTCHCGAGISEHNDCGPIHSFVPMGCACGYVRDQGSDGDYREVFGEDPPKKPEPKPYSMEWIKGNAAWGQI